ncbi:MAG: AAA family ATPase [Lachnospiraceae bacterium]|nr:AAA family ATPase [Lachnospiraceae bacterium]
MGYYLNPTTKGFQDSLNSEIYVDKTGLIEQLNRLINTEQRFVCVSRPRRFGKSMAIKMLSAYYNSESDSDELFRELEIGSKPSYRKYLNQYQVMRINMQEFLSESNSIEEMLDLIEKSILWELLDNYKGMRFFNEKSLIRTMTDIYRNTQKPFVVLIDEWDCIFREYRDRKEDQEKYLDFLRNWMKDKEYIALAYMTGILPIKKYGTHSALNMFTEYSMTNPGNLAGYFGFTTEEVQELCDRYQMNFEETKVWYDGYSLGKIPSVYNPRSVVGAMLAGAFDTYWNQTETFEALRTYIDMNYDGLKDAIISMLAGARVQIDVRSFSNDMTTFHNYEDVLTLLVHLGYLAYHWEREEVYIPNKEISKEYITAIRNTSWGEIIQAVKESEKLLQSVWEMDCEAVAAGIEKAHYETSILTYHNENALSYTISLAFYAAREYYTVFRELPTGKGFADVVFIPRKKAADKPALVIELKYDKSAEGAIAQIMNKKYTENLLEYQGNILLVGINYDKETKTHTCLIQRTIR